MKELYVLATRETTQVTWEALSEAMEGDDVELTRNDDGFTVVAGEAKTTVRFEVIDGPLGYSPEFLTGSEESMELLRQARGFYRISFEPGIPQPSVAVFEALWCARALMEQREGVLLDISAFKLHDAQDVQEITELDFDIRDHLNLHAVEVADGETPLWVHTHGMEKFGTRDVEIFHLSENDLPAAESFVQQLCTDLAFGQGPQLRTPVEAGDETFMLVPSEEARSSLMGVPLEAFEGHEGMFLSVLSGTGRHNVAELLRPYRDHFEEEPEEITEALRKSAEELLPAFKARFLRRGLMEPWSFRVRAGFESHPEGETIQENLWVEVISWESGAAVGKLIDGSSHTTEWRKGAQVTVDEAAINALSLGRDGRVLEDQELKELLQTERPM